MEIITGKILKAQKIVLYGPEGIGKTTFAANFPKPLFIDTEGSTTHIDVARTPKPSSWSMLLEQIEYVKNNPSVCKTLIIDTADWAETLCIKHICDKAHKVSGIEDFGYGKGYTYLKEEFGSFLNKLQDITEKGIHVLLTAHAHMRKFEQPDEIGAYDRWELKLEKKTSAITKEWADMILFANYKTMVINVDNQGASKGKNKAQGGRRIMYTSHHPCWDAKNRHGLAEELSLDFKEIEKAINFDEAISKPIQETPIEEVKPVDIIVNKKTSDLPSGLEDLMKSNNVLESEIQRVVAQKGYFPEKTPIKNYPKEFIDGVLIAAWDQVFSTIKNNREDEDDEEETAELPFTV